MKAAIITAGSELTDGRVLDTNTAFLARRLDSLGVKVVLTLSVPDDRELIVAAINFALGEKPGLVVITGGLGPTEDDLTAPAVAAALDLKLELSGQAEEYVRAAVGASGELPPHQAKQAMMPPGSSVIRPAGTAPGFIVNAGGGRVVALPGVPWELRAMWEDAVSDPRVSRLLSAARPPARGRLSFYGVAEAEIGAAVGKIMGRNGAGLDVSICSRRGEVMLEVTADSKDEGRVQELVKTLKQNFSDFVFSEGEEIENVVAARLTGMGATLAVGESCTGGMLGEAITRVPGASAFFLGGVTAYSNDVKRNLLKVRQETLDNVGAVSEPVAQQLALGARSLTGSDYGAGITGVAGPGGGTAEKPVGLVFICVSSDAGDVVRRFDFPGGRGQVRQSAVTAALHMLHWKIIADP